MDLSWKMFIATNPDTFETAILSNSTCVVSNLTNADCDKNLSWWITFGTKLKNESYSQPVASTWLLIKRKSVELFADVMLLLFLFFNLN